LGNTDIERCVIKFMADLTNKFSRDVAMLRLYNDMQT